MTITSKSIEKIKCEIQNKIEGYEKSLKDRVEMEEKLRQILLKYLDKMRKSESIIREAKKELKNIEEYENFKKNIE